MATAFTGKQFASSSTRNFQAITSGKRVVGLVLLLVGSRRALRLAGTTKIEIASRIALHATPATMAATRIHGRTRMSSLSSKQGPRYRHTADSTEPYETIAAEKLTPIIGAELTCVGLAK